MFETREVWRKNVEEEMNHVKDCVKRFSMIAFDTEFPGVMFRTRRDASEDETYRNMKISVEGTKLIQFGFTLFNRRGEIGGTWEVNFSNFGDASDIRNEDSIAFLARHNVDLKKIREEGIDMFEYGFFPKFFGMLAQQGNIQWVTFHGNYDLAYVMSILNKGLTFSAKLPDTPDGFSFAVGQIFGIVYDLKVIASAYQWLGGHLGLEQLAQKLHIRRIGQAHHSGSDSLLTASVFIKINQLFTDTREAGGYLYGMRRRAVPTRPSLSSDATAMFHYASKLSYASILCNGYPSYDPRMLYNGSSCLDPMSFYKAVSADLCNDALPYMVQTPNPSDSFASISSAYNDNSCYVVD